MTKRFCVLAILAVIVIALFQYIGSRAARRAALSLDAVVVTTKRDCAGKEYLTAYDCRTASRVVRGGVPKLFVLSNGKTLPAVDQVFPVLELDSNGHRKKSQLFQDLEDYPSVGQALGNGRIYVAGMRRGVPCVACYDGKGQLLQEIEVKIRAVDFPLAYMQKLAVAPNYMALVMCEKGHEELSHVYVIDYSGNLVRVFRNAQQPVFAAKGRYIAYMKVRPGSRHGSPIPLGRIVVDDVLTKRTRCEVDVNSRWDIPAVVFGIAPDGNSIVIQSPLGRTLSTYREVFVVDVRRATPRWVRLPVLVKRADWVVLDKVPDSFVSVDRRR